MPKIRIKTAYNPRAMGFLSWVIRPSPSTMPIPRITATVLAYSKVEPTLTPSAVFDGYSTGFVFWSTPYPAITPTMRFMPSMNGPTSRREDNEDTARVNEARYIEERNSSLTVWVWAMLQVKDRPFTATSTARIPTSIQAILGVSAK